MAKNLVMKIQHVAGFRLVRRSVVQNIHDSSTFLLEISINRQECWNVEPASSLKHSTDIKALNNHVLCQQTELKNTCYLYKFV